MFTNVKIKTILLKNCDAANKNEISVWVMIPQNENIRKKMTPNAANTGFQNEFPLFFRCCQNVVIVFLLERLEPLKQSFKIPHLWIRTK